MKKKRKKSKNKINYWLLFLIILLAIALILSRTRRASRRAAYRPPAVEQQDNDKNASKDTLKEKTIQETFEIDKKYLLGNITPSQSEKMVEIESRYASRAGMFMHKDAYRAFQKMHEAAENDGVDLAIISAMRTFDHQKRIWDNKWNGEQKLFGDIYATEIADPVERAKEILRFSAMPGTSRHHWGTDIDLNSLQNEYFENGEGKEIYQWLINNAQYFGFCQPYTPHGQDRGGGYEEEKWHWSYKPVAAKYLQAFKNSIDYDDIAGFEGDQTARRLNVIEKYVMQIDPECEY